VPVSGLSVSIFVVVATRRSLERVSASAEGAILEVLVCGLRWATC